jgi:hypothetical protein
VKIKNEWGVINSKGETVINCQYDLIPEIKGQAIVAKRGDLYGMVSINNVQLVPFNYDKYQWMDDNIIKFENDGKFGYYNIRRSGWIWHEE